MNEQLVEGSDDLTTISVKTSGARAWLQAVWFQMEATEINQVCH